MAISRQAVIDIIMNAHSIDDMLMQIDDLNDVRLVMCNDCGSIFTEDYSDFDCYECGSDNVSILGCSIEGIVDVNNSDMNNGVYKIREDE